MADPTILYELPPVCPICLDERDGWIGTLKPCNHQFHKMCIREWHSYASNLKCPNCRIPSSSLEVRYGNTNLSKSFSVDLENSFNVKNFVALEEENWEAELIRYFAHTLSLSRYTTSNDPNFFSCCICGEESSDGVDCSCRECSLFYHELCLRSLSSEVGDRESWQQCLDCRNPIRHIISRRRRPFNGHIHEAAGSEEFVNAIGQGGLVHDFDGNNVERLRTNKSNIQKHVRDVLNTYYKIGINGVKINKRDFTVINKAVSRRLYAISGYKYRHDLIDYDAEAEREVHIELRKLGYI